MIKYNFNITNMRFDLSDKNLFIIQGWFGKNNSENSHLEVSLDDEMMNIDTKAYSSSEIRRKYIARDPFVDTEYNFYVRLPADYAKYENLFIYTVNKEEKILTLAVNTVDLQESQANLDSCIDSTTYNKKQKNCLITGWVVAKEPVRLSVATLDNEMLEADISRNKREDVLAYYRQDNIDSNCGFRIVVNNRIPSKLIVKMTTNECETIHVVEGKPSVVKNKVRGVLRYTVDRLRYLKNNGFKKTFEHSEDRPGKKPIELSDMGYGSWRLRNIPTDKVLKGQKKQSFAYAPTFSIVVPLYKTPKIYLDALVDSIQCQTYANWELCLSDGSGPESPLAAILNQYGKKDKRIKVTSNKEQLRISENTNEAIKMATGDYIVFADHDDLLAPNALFECSKALDKDNSIEVLYSDEDKVSMDGKTYFMPHFKPDFNIDLLRTTNYISHLFVVKKDVLNHVGYLNPELDGSQDYDLILRCIEYTKNIHHIPKVLYHWRAHKDSTAENPESKLYAFEAGERAVRAHYERVGLHAAVSQGESLGLYKTTYAIEGQPLISVIIPNKDHIEDLDHCIQAIEKKSSYKNYEYIIVENNSTEPETFEYYNKLEAANKKVKVIKYKGDFNYSLINNYGVTFAKGDYLLLLNNDTQIINEDCMEQLLGFCMREDVGIVGARLYYEDDTIQHAGVIVGVSGIAGHAFIGNSGTDPGYFGRVICVQDYSAVTAACMMVKKEVYNQVGGLSPELAVAFNDIDFCLKVRRLGKLIVYNPYAQLYHYESKSRGHENTPDKIVRFNREIEIFRHKWSDILENGDPYYNPNFSTDSADFTLAKR